MACRSGKFFAASVLGGGAPVTSSFAFSHKRLNTDDIDVYRMARVDARFYLKKGLDHYCPV